MQSNIDQFLFRTRANLFGFKFGMYISPSELDGRLNYEWLSQLYMMICELGSSLLKLACNSAMTEYMYGPYIQLIFIIIDETKNNSLLSYIAIYILAIYMYIQFLIGPSFNASCPAP